jgi:hypothetical protein
LVFPPRPVDHAGAKGRPQNDEGLNCQPPRITVRDLSEGGMLSAHCAKLHPRAA